MTAADSDLDVRVEQGLPQTLPAGSANALFVFGTCFHKRRRVAGLEVVVDGVPTAATAFGMPRIDLYRELNPPTPWADSGSGSADDPLRHSYRSGFWATVPVRVPDSGEVEVAVRAELDDGSSAELQLEPIASGSSRRSWGRRAGASASLAVCMATWESEPELIRAQIESSCSSAAATVVELGTDGDLDLARVRDPDRHGYPEPAPIAVAKRIVGGAAAGVGPQHQQVQLPVEVDPRHPERGRRGRHAVDDDLEAGDPPALVEAGAEHEQGIGAAGGQRLRQPVLDANVQISIGRGHRSRCYGLPCNRPGRSRGRIASCAPG